MILDTILPKTVVKWHLLSLTTKPRWSTPEVENTMLRGTWQFWNTRSGILQSMTLKPSKFHCCLLKQPARNMAKKREITGINVSFRVSSFCSWSLLAWPKLWVERWSYSDYLLSSTYEMRNPHENPKLLSTKFIQIQRDSQPKTASSLPWFGSLKTRKVPQHLCSRQSFPSPAGLELEVSTRIIYYYWLSQESGKPGPQGVFVCLVGCQLLYCSSLHFAKHSAASILLAFQSKLSLRKPS